MALAALLTAAFGTLIASFAYQRALKDPSPPPGWSTLKDKVAALETRLTSLEGQPGNNLDPLLEHVEALEGAVGAFGEELEEKFNANQRREARIRETLRRAEEKYEESGELSPGAIAEIEEFRRLNGERSEPEGVQPMPEGVEGGTPSSIPGVTVQQLRQARLR